jgi:hypothetical protein
MADVEEVHRDARRARRHRARRQAGTLPAHRGRGRNVGTEPPRVRRARADEPDTAGGPSIVVAVTILVFGALKRVLQDRRAQRPSVGGGCAGV